MTESNVAHKIYKHWNMFAITHHYFQASLTFGWKVKNWKLMSSRSHCVVLASEKGNHTKAFGWNATFGWRHTKRKDGTWLANYLKCDVLSRSKKQADERQNGKSKWKLYIFCTLRVACVSFGLCGFRISWYMCDSHGKTNKFSIERKNPVASAFHEEEIIELIPYVHHALICNVCAMCTVWCKRDSLFYCVVVVVVVVNLIPADVYVVGSLCISQIHCNAADQHANIDQKMWRETKLTTFERKGLDECWNL